MNTVKDPQSLLMLYMQPSSASGKIQPPEREKPSKGNVEKLFRKCWHISNSKYELKKVKNREIQPIDGTQSFMALRHSPCLSVLPLLLMANNSHNDNYGLPCLALLDIDDTLIKDPLSSKFPPEYSSKKAAYWLLDCKEITVIAVTSREWVAGSPAERDLGKQGLNLVSDNNPLCLSSQEAERFCQSFPKESELETRKICCRNNIVYTRAEDKGPVVVRLIKCLEQSREHFSTIIFADDRLDNIFNVSENIQEMLKENQDQKRTVLLSWFEAEYHQKLSHPCLCYLPPTIERVKFQDASIRKASAPATEKPLEAVDRIADKGNTEEDEKPE